MPAVEAIGVVDERWSAADEELPAVLVTRYLEYSLPYRLILGRTPTTTEQKLSEEFLAHSPLSELCRALFNLNAFVYVE